MEYDFPGLTAVSDGLKYVAVSETDFIFIAKDLTHISTLVMETVSNSEKLVYLNHLIWLLLENSYCILLLCKLQDVCSGSAFIFFRPGYDVTYVGSIDTGKCGDVQQIDDALKRILLKSQGASHHPALFEIQEIGIKVIECSTGKVCGPYIKEGTFS